MIVDYTNLGRMASLPAKYNSPLIVDSDRMKPPPFSFERFKSIAGRNTQIAEIRGVMQIKQLTSRRAPQLRRKSSRFSRPSIEEQILGESIAETFDHLLILS